MSDALRSPGLVRSARALALTLTAFAAGAGTLWLVQQNTADPPATKSLWHCGAAVRDGRVRLSCFMSPALSERHLAGPGPELRLYRQSADDFRFGVDYSEYFDGMHPTPKDLVYQGKPSRRQSRKLILLDEDVGVRRTYVYWVAVAPDEAPVGPIAVRIRHPEVWWPFARVDAVLSDLAGRRPDAVVESFGETLHHRPLRGLRIGSSERTIALIGALHAGESGPELLLPVVERLIEERSDLLDRVGVAVLPSVNADERERLVDGYPAYLRKNAAGVDLNRNFDGSWETVDQSYGLSSDDPESDTYRGHAPHSEPETRAVVAFVERTDPSAVFSYHHLASVTYGFLLAPKSAESRPPGGEWLRLARSFHSGFYGAFRQDKLAFWTSDGSLPAWGHQRHGIPGFDLEGDSGPDAEQAALDATTPEILERARKLHFQGLVAVLEALAES